jgi:sortase (surface protein transpeptidase)
MSGLLGLLLATLALHTAPVTTASTDPVRVLIPAIGVDAPVIPLGLNPDKTLQAPDLHRVNEVGWFNQGPRPGAVGPAIFDAHFDGYGKQGAFYRLKDVHAGDLVQIKEANGVILTFHVYRTQEVPKAAFPTDVYGDRTRPELVLITCGGNWVGGKYGYRDSEIVYAA